MNHSSASPSLSRFRTPASASSATARRHPAQDAAALWEAYWQSNRGVAARNALIEHYLPLVRFAALRLASRNGRRAQSADVDDLVQHGTFGLKDAIRNFDPARGAKFETYCLQRVRGAMLDGLKLHHWVPRDLRKQIARYNVAHEEAIAELGPEAPRDALAARLGVCPETLAELEQGAARMQIGSLHAAEGPDADAAADHLADSREEEALLALQREDVRNLFFTELTRSERHLLMLYYYEEMTMREIGAALGISGTRVSQIHTDIVGRLRSRLMGRVRDELGRIRPAHEI
jgi:RNA polymerase sigma factor for flagellar operon FliA